jgi:hypothetical protein
VRRSGRASTRRWNACTRRRSEAAQIRGAALPAGLFPPDWRASPSPRPRTARARDEEAALAQGGEAAADAAEAGGDAFVRLPHNLMPYGGTLAGADKPEALVRFEEEMAGRNRAARQAAPSRD